MQKIILASQSPRRRELVNILKIPFDIYPSRIDEIVDSAVSPNYLVELLAKQKCLAVAKHYPEGIVIGADSIVSIDEGILGKPADKEDAKSMLRILRGRWHCIITGVAVLEISSNLLLSNVITTKIKMRNYSEQEIIDYIEKENPFDRAGSYGLQESGIRLVETVDGCYSNALGLPMCEVIRMLQVYNVYITSPEINTICLVPMEFNLVQTQSRNCCQI